jgi:peptide-methionine (R)-S-oxide reductase
MTVPPTRFTRRSAPEWQTRLDDLAFRVTRMGETERPFSHVDFPPGPATYHCRCCTEPLFDASARFDPGCCGWPAFSRPLGPAKLREVADDAWCLCRTEVRCANCDAHLGHVFADGPQPTGLRYCINGVALHHVPK